jgi:cytokinin dehydrogenase
MLESLLAHRGMSASPDDLAGAADDFGHIVHQVPAMVARPIIAEEVTDLVRAELPPLVPRGAGYSVYGQAQSEDGIVCDLSGLNQVHRTDPDSIVVDAGARWSRVVEHSRQVGLTPPALPNYLELSVGGTLSSGGIAGTSYQHGPQVDHVISLDVVTPDGELVTCSRDQNPDVFFSALGTFGAGGIIVRAEIPLVTAPVHVRIYRLRYPDLNSLIADQLMTAREQRFDHISGQILPGEHCWEFILEAGVFTDGVAFAGDSLLDGLGDERSLMGSEDMDYFSFCHRLLSRVRQLARSGDWYMPHPWFSAFLAAGQTERYVTRVLDALTPEPLTSVSMLISPLRRGQVPAPGLRTPEGEDLFYTFSLLRTVDYGMLPACLEHNAALHRAALECGGVTHRVSALA